MILDQAYIDLKYQDWLTRLSPSLAAVLRDELQTRLEMQRVDAELSGVPLWAGMPDVQKAAVTTAMGVAQ